MQKEPEFSFSPIQLADNIEALELLLSDRSMLQYMDLPSWSEPDEIAKLLATCRNGLACLFIIYRNGMPCGITGLSHICLKHRFAYITVGILEQYQQLGIGERALALAEKVAFEELNLNRIEAQIHCDNNASLQFVSNHGYEREGRMRENFLIDGTFYDSILFAKLKNS